MEGTTTSTAPTQGASQAPAQQTRTSLTNRGGSKGKSTQNIQAESSASSEPVVTESQGVVDEHEPKSKQGYKLVKADGQEYEVDEKAYHEAARKAFTADKRIWEAAQKEKKLLEREAQLADREKYYQSLEQKTPAQIFADVQKKLKDPNTTQEFRVAAEKWLTEQLLMEEASPEQRRIKELEQRLAEREELEKAELEKQTKAKKEQELQGYRKTAQESILNVIKMSNLPATESLVKAIADIKYNAARAGAKLSDEQVANILKADTMESSNALFGEFANSILKAKESNDIDGVLRSGDALLSTVPESLIKALRIYDYFKHTHSRGKAPVQQETTPEIGKEDKKAPYQYGSLDEERNERQKIVEALQKEWEAKRSKVS